MACKYDKKEKIIGRFIFYVEGEREGRLNKSVDNRRGEDAVSDSVEM